MIHLFIEITKLPVKQIALIVLIPAVTNLIYMTRENYNNYEYTKNSTYMGLLEGKKPTISVLKDNSLSNADK